MHTVKRVAILGANSQIARDYVSLALEQTERKFYLFSRNPQVMSKGLDVYFDYKFELCGYNSFGSHQYDMIVNFVGNSDPVYRMQPDNNIFSVTDKFDNLAINYLKNNHQCKYIFISSGAAYGDIFALQPAFDSSKSVFDFDSLSQSEHYGAAKYLAEQRHRSLPNFHIADIRIFSYFSKTQSMNSKLFLSQLIFALKNNIVFHTTADDMWRDYIGPSDFYRLLECVINASTTNFRVDCYTKMPISKSELLSFFVNHYGLRVKVIDTEKSVKNSCNSYFSKNKFAESIGYYPALNSIDTVKLAMTDIMKND